MQYILYGINRVSKDFIYIFDDMISIVAVCDENYTDGDFLCKEVISIEKAISMCDDECKIIVCDFEKEERIHKLEAFGLRKSVNFLCEEELFELLDPIKYNPNDKPIILWGTGLRAGKFLQWNTKYTIDFCVDSYREEKTYYEYSLKKPDEVTDWKKFFVIIAVAKDKEIKDYLAQMGLCEGTDYCNMQDLTSIPSQMLRDTIFDRSYYEFCCNTMLNHAEFHQGGRIDCCCSTFLDFSLGNVNQDAFKDIWGGIRHRIAALSTQNHTYTFCKKDMCPFFIEKKIGESKLSNEVYHNVEEHPRVALVSYDNGCNLKCVTCRKDFIVTKGTELQQTELYADMVKREILPYAQFMIMAGNGEVFLNKSYKKLYMSEEASNLEEIRFLSNGLLFNENTWKDVKQNIRGKIMLTVSIDAATKDTYEYIRSGGNFDVLKKNMEFAGELRRTGKLSYFRMNFVVQKKNYLEMPMFVEWGKQLGCDEVFFTKILNWGTYTSEEFKEISMMQEDGITPKQELQEILNLDIMKDPIVDLGTIQYGRDAVDVEFINNYYMWEMRRKS